MIVVPSLVALFLSFACAPAPRPESTPPEPAAATPEPTAEPAEASEPTSAPTPTEATEAAPTGLTAGLHHPGAPRTRSVGGTAKLTAKATPPPATSGGPASPCAGRAAGERWEQPGGGTCTCRPDGEVSCRRVEARKEVADPQGG